MTFAVTVAPPAGCTIPPVSFDVYHDLHTVVEDALRRAGLGLDPAAPLNVELIIR